MANDPREPEEGQEAPDFTLPSTAGEDFTLSRLFSDEGKIQVVLFFYPKDDTSGCTREAQDFTQHLADFEADGVTVVGISPDPVSKHLKFQEKHDLNTVLLADEEKQVCQLYGVWVEKQMYGRRYMGVERSTFLIGADRRIKKAWRKVKVAGHVADVLETARQNNC